MPLIRVQLSVAVDEKTRGPLMASLSKAVAQALGKPEGYMMVVLEGGIPLLMGASAEPAAFVEVRSVGTISPDQARRLAGTVSDILAGTGVSTDRIYANFAGVPGAMWGHGGDTFG